MSVASVTIIRYVYVPTPPGLLMCWLSQVCHNLLVFNQSPVHLGKLLLLFGKTGVLSVDHFLLLIEPLFQLGHLLVLHLHSRLGSVRLLLQVADRSVRFLGELLVRLGDPVQVGHEGHSARARVSLSPKPVRETAPCRCAVHVQACGLYGSQGRAADCGGVKVGIPHTKRVAWSARYWNCGEEGGLQGRHWAGQGGDDLLVKIFHRHAGDVS